MVPFGCNGFPYDPLYRLHGRYIRDIYPFIALRTHGKFKDLFIFEFHKEYMRPGYMRSESYPHGPNHALALFGHKVDKLYYPYNPRTVKQQTWRSYMTKAIANWHSFDQPTKDFYKSFHPWEHNHPHHRYLHLYLIQCRRDFY